MALHDDLLEQANHLAKRERRKPRQASLRRAVSSAYYAMFHLLLWESTGRTFGALAARRRFRHSLARGFSHQSMVKVCKSFAATTLPPKIMSFIAPFTVPSDLQLIAETFVTLQDKRRRADYNLAAPFHRAEVVAILEAAQTAFEAWDRVKPDDAAAFFLAVLPL